MEFCVPCECGQKLRVGVCDAGSTKACQFGRNLLIPSLSTLRETAGLDAYEICPSAEINQAVAQGTWVLSGNCSHCDCGTDSAVWLHGVCEQRWLESGSDSGLDAFPILSMIFGGLVGSILVRSMNIPSARYGKEMGRDVSFKAPFRLCESCQRALRSKRGALTFAKSVPALQKLLSKYPDANFRFLKASEAAGLNSQYSRLRRSA